MSYLSLKVFGKILDNQSIFCAVLVILQNTNLSLPY